jgi:transposase
MNSKEIFSLALGLQAPFYISEVELKQEENGGHKLDIYLDYESGSLFKDTEGQDCKVHDRLERTWRHLNFFQHTCYIHCRVPRILTTEGKVKQIDVPWARPGSGFTLLFEAYTMCLIESEMPVNKVGNLLEEYPNRIWTIFDYWIGIAYSEADHSKITNIGIDETSARKGHDYVTVCMDTIENRVVYACEGKGAECITQIADYLESKGSPAREVKEVCIDLSPAFISGTTKKFENATICFDRFHVKQLLNKAMDEVRLKERALHEELKGHKYLFLKNRTNLSKRQKQELDSLLTLLPSIGEAYRLKELFDDFWSFNDPQEAAGFLAFWCDLVAESKIFPLIKFAQTVKVHWTGICNYIQSRVTNAILEGTNAKIQLAKRRARGYRKTSNFINMIYFIAGKLKFNFPHYST